MFSGKTIVNGVELPSEFNGCNVINNIALSQDGTRYAVIGDKGSLIMGDVPADGRIEVNGTKITVQKGRVVSTSSSTFSFSNVTIGGGISIGNVTRVPEEISKSFPGVQDVIIRSLATGFNLAVHDSDEVKVHGTTFNEPELSGGTLDLGNFTGTVTLPRSGVRISGEALAGSINGEISSPGKLKALAGSINITLSGPIAIQTKNLVGGVSVSGMMSAGRNRFEPPNHSGSGFEVLNIETLAAGINVTYKNK